MQTPLFSTETGNSGQRPFLANLYFALFLQRIGQKDFSEAQGYLAEAMELFPGLGEQLEKLSQLIIDCAFSQLSSPPLALAASVLDSLPSNFAALAQLRRRVLGKIHIAQAFGEYAAGHSSQACRHVLTGVRHDPSFLKNRGVISILAKSVLNYHPPAIDQIHGPSDPDETIPKSVIDEVEAVLGSAVDRVEPIGRYANIEHIEAILQGSAADSVESDESENRSDSVYLIQAGTQPYALRLVEKDMLRQHIAVEDLVRAVGVPIPTTLASSEPMANNEPAWLLEEWVSGSWFDPSRVSHADELTIAADLGRYLCRLHTIRAKGFGWISSPQLDAPYRTFGAWLDGRERVMEEACLTGAMPETVLPVLDTAVRFLRESYGGPPVLCHRDLQRANIMIEGTRITAIIDWEGQEACDPAYDIAVLLSRMSRFWCPPKDNEILTAILRGYDPAGPDDFRRRIIAHRLLFAAREVARLVKSGDDPELLGFNLSILEDAVPVN